jgi:type I restriction enzyme S subunit
MSKTNENILIPKLRFPEFQKKDNWQLTTIGEIGSFYYGKSAPKWSLSSDAPTLCVRYGELYTKFDTIISEIISRTNIDPSNLKFSKGGEILVPRVGEVPQDFAKNCCYLPFPNIAIGEMISVFETKEYPIFYAYYFRTLIKQFAEVVEGQNVKNLYFVNLEPIAIGKPSYLEQKKIAACLSSIDEVINAESLKLESLKKHKKGLMQNLFPQEGETVPNWRFKEFTKDGKWDTKSIGEIFNSFSGGTPSTSERKYYGGGIPFIRSAEINKEETDLFLTEEGLKNSSAKLVNKGDLLVALYGANSGDSAISKIDGAINQAILCLQSEYSNSYSYYFLTFKKDWIVSRFIQGGQGNLSGDIVKSILIPFPKKSEQNKIASCLSSLDELITAQLFKIEQLKLHKKGLTQGLFPKVID